MTGSRWLSEYVNGSISLFGEQLKYRDPTSDAPDDHVSASWAVNRRRGFRSSIFRDTRDYYLDPRTGWRFSIGADYGTPALGGTNNFYKLLC